MVWEILQTLSLSQIFVPYTLICKKRRSPATDDNKIQYQVFFYKFKIFLSCGNLQGRISLSCLITQVKGVPGLLFMPTRNALTTWVEVIVTVKYILCISGRYSWSEQCPDTCIPSTWLWWWLPFRLSKCQSMLPIFNISFPWELLSPGQIITPERPLSLWGFILLLHQLVRMLILGMLPPPFC